jgi:hypothetical protein
VDYSALLENGEGGNPNGNETVLAKGKAKARMADDIQSKLAVAPGVSQLVGWGTPQRNTAKDEWSGVVGELLLAVPAFLTHQADGIELFDFAFRETERWQYGLD